MLIRKPSDLRYSDVTPKELYLNRRGFMAAGAAALGALANPFTAAAETKLNDIKKSPFSTTETPTPHDAVISYNNYYEFGTGKDEPVRLAKNFKTNPWTVSLEGEVMKPKTPMLTPPRIVSDEQITATASLRLDLNIST